MPDSALDASILLRSDKDGVATLTLNRPDARNALSVALMTALEDAFAKLSADKSVKAIVIAGSSSQTTSVGHRPRGSETSQASRSAIAR